MTLADGRQLEQPEVLRAQVERMLGDPKSMRFVENFTGQWLRLRDIDFTVSNPSISAESWWVRVEAQEKLLVPARVRLRRDPHSARIAGTTENVARLSLSVENLVSADTVKLTLDEQELTSRNGLVSRDAILDIHERIRIAVDHQRRNGELRQRLLP